MDGFIQLAKILPFDRGSYSDCEVSDAWQLAERGPRNPKRHRNNRLASVIPIKNFAAE
jgi:hypothetical protein